MTTKYYLSKQGQQLGPLSPDEVLQHITTHQLGWDDYIYDEAKSDWILLSEHADFSAHFKANLSAPAAKHVEAPVIAEGINQKEWFVLKGENKYGPFSFLEMVRLLQEKNLYEFDYIWNADLAGWNRVSECEQFAPEKIRALRDVNAVEAEEIFFRRRHARAKYGASVLVHNNKLVWKGKSLEISVGGAGLMLDTPFLDPGQTVFLHFKVGDDVPPFNAICSVVSKQISPSGEEVKYGVKFTNINREVQNAIKTFTMKAA